MCLALSPPSNPLFYLSCFTERNYGHTFFFLQQYVSAGSAHSWCIVVDGGAEIFIWTQSVFSFFKIGENWTIIMSGNWTQKQHQWQRCCFFLARWWWWRPPTPTANICHFTLGLGLTGKMPYIAPNGKWRVNRYWREAIISHGPT